MKFNHQADKVTDAIGFVNKSDVVKEVEQAIEQQGKTPLTDKQKLAMLMICVTPVAQMLSVILEDILGKPDSMQSASRVIEYLFNTLDSDDTYYSLLSASMDSMGII